VACGHFQSSFLHRVWIVFFQLKMLLLTWSGTGIPSISPACTQSRRRFTQVIHRFLHRKPGARLARPQQRISHDTLTLSHDTDELTRSTSYLRTHNCLLAGRRHFVTECCSAEWIGSGMRRMKPNNLTESRLKFASYQFVRQCAGLQAGGDGGRTRPGSGGRVLLLGVLARDRDGRCAGRAGEVRRGPQPSRPPVVRSQAGGFLPQPAGRHAGEGFWPAGEIASVGGRFTSRCTRSGSPLSSGQLGPGVRVHVPHDRHDAVRVPRGGHPVPGDEHQAGARIGHAVPASADVLY
jgi:hypothetical protein